MSATFLPILDYGDVVYQHAPSYLLSSLDALYHGALRFITDSKFTTHHCELYEKVAWPPLRIQRKMHWHLLIYKAIFRSFAKLSMLFYTKNFVWKSFIAFSIKL